MQLAVTSNAGRRKHGCSGAYGHYRACRVVCPELFVSGRFLDLSWRPAREVPPPRLPLELWPEASGASRGSEQPSGASSLAWQLCACTAMVMTFTNMSQ
jgi:hypothetical protein